MENEPAHGNAGDARSHPAHRSRGYHKAPAHRARLCGERLARDGSRILLISNSLHPLHAAEIDGDLRQPFARGGAVPVWHAGGEEDRLAGQHFTHGLPCSWTRPRPFSSTRTLRRFIILPSINPSMQRTSASSVRVLRGSSP